MVSETLLGVIIGGILGFGSSIGVNLFWNWYTQPVLSIEKEVQVRWFELESGEHRNYNRRYCANRVKVRNKGRSAAENCKASLIMEDSEEKISWIIPAERYTLTLNADDREWLDVCAIRDDGTKRIAPTEHSWGNNENESRDLGSNEIEAELKVSARNAKPFTRKIRILNTLSHRGKIVEFMD